MTKDTPTIMVTLEKGKLVPDTPYDAELLDGYASGSLFALKDRSRRSTPQNSYYWVKLNRIVDATGGWANAETLHKQVLRACGYVTQVMSLNGGIRDEPDSTAFSAMKPKEFTQYTIAADAVLAEATGIDIDAMMEEKT